MKNDIIGPKTADKSEFNESYFAIADTFSSDVKKIFNSTKNISNAHETIDAPSNLKNILDELRIDLRRKNKTIGAVKHYSFIHNTFFLHDLDSLIKKTYITKLDRNILMYALLTYLGETISTDEVDLITPKKKIRFNFQNDTYKSQIALELARVKDEEVIKVANKKIWNFGILSTKTNKIIAQKRTEMSYHLIDTAHIKALQNLEEYDKLNSINIRINSHQIINDLTKYKIYIYRFIIEDLLFSSSVTNDTNVIIITCNGLNDVKEALINDKIFKALGVINLFQIKNWSRVKGNSNSINAVFVDSQYPSVANHFSFSFITKNLSDLLDFTFH